ncbi:MAG: DinB family protein [Ferruginibacter sp.]
METITEKKTSMHALLNMYDWHTKLFKNVLIDISDKDAGERLNTKANHIAWIAGSMVHGRYDLANLFGLEMEQSSNQLFENNKGIQDNAAYPSLETYRRDWEIISPLLRQALANASEERLNGPDPFNMPGGPYTFFDTLVACTDRESYCIGQVGLWRRLLGYEAMKYM